MLRKRRCPSTASRVDEIRMVSTPMSTRRVTSPGGNEYSVRPLDDFEDVLVDVVGHSEHLEIEVDGCAIEHAKHQALPELRRQCRHAKVDTAPGDIFLNPAILRKPTLGDIHVR